MSKRFSPPPPVPSIVQVRLVLTALCLVAMALAGSAGSHWS